MSTRDPNNPIHDQVRDLTETHRHREPYTYGDGRTTWTSGHVTTVPPLLTQLGQATQQSMGDGGGSGGYKSRPPAFIESMDTLATIDLEASRWVRDLGEDDPGNTGACVRRLHGLHASAHRCDNARAQRDDEHRVTCCSQHAIEVDVRRWWTQARIVTGWDSAAWRPDNTCPLCGKRGTLRVKLSAHSGMCIDCRETWDETTIGLLADHIRAENQEDDEPAPPEVEELDRHADDEATS